MRDVLLPAVVQPVARRVTRPRSRARAAARARPRPRRGAPSPARARRRMWRRASVRLEEQPRLERVLLEEPAQQRPRLDEHRAIEVVERRAHQPAEREVVAPGDGLERELRPARSVGGVERGDLRRRVLEVDAPGVVGRGDAEHGVRGESLVEPRLAREHAEARLHEEVDREVEAAVGGARAVGPFEDHVPGFPSGGVVDRHAPEPFRERPLRRREARLARRSPLDTARAVESTRKEPPNGSTAAETGSPKKSRNQRAPRSTVASAWAASSSGRSVSRVHSRRRQSAVGKPSAALLGPSPSCRIASDRSAARRSITASALASTTRRSRSSDGVHPSTASNVSPSAR